MSEGVRQRVGAPRPASGARPTTGDNNAERARKGKYKNFA